MPKITKRVLDAYPRPSSGKDAFLWDSGDGALKGFGVRFKPSGIGSYLVQYRNKEGRTRRIVLGRVGVLMPDEARLQAISKLAAVAKGEDPSLEKAQARKGTRIDELCDWYLEEAEGVIKASTLAVDRSRIEAHVKPLLGSRTVSQLIRADLEQFQRDIASGKTARREKIDGKLRLVKGGKGAAARTLGMLHTILEFGVRKGIMTANPAKGIRKYPDKKVTRYLSRDELKALGAALCLHEKESPIAVAAIRTLVLTGCRRNEILSLPKSSIDFVSKCLRLEDTKSGPQLRPTGGAALKILSAQKEMSEKYIFPSARGQGHFVGLPKVLDRVCKSAGLVNVTVHTFRHTFAATAAELGYSELTIAGLLGHAVKGVTARYAHVPDRALVAAADAVAEHISRTLDGLASADVVQIADARGSYGR